jgi:hypothetical protein
VVSPNAFRLVTGALRGILTPAAALLLSAGLVLATMAACTALEYRDAVELPAPLSAKEVVPPEERGKHKPRFVARYRIALPGGKTVEAEEVLSQRDWEALAPGSEHRILYVPENGKILPRPWSDAFASSVIMAVLGVIFTIVGGLLFRKLLQRLSAAIRLSTRGVATTATVTDVFQTATAVNGVALWRLRYRYRDSRGAEHETESGLLCPDEGRAWARGATGAILYDPAQPAASAWLGREETPGEMQGRLAQGIGSRARALLRWGVALTVFFGALVAAAVMAELVPQLGKLDGWINERRTSLLLATGGAAGVGVLLLIGSVLLMLGKSGERMSHRSIEHQQRAIRDAAAGPLWRTSTYRFIGRAMGAEAHDEFSMAQLKRAVASGALMRDPVWRRRACATCGGALIFVGLFGVMLVVTPLALKLVLFAAFAYAVVRISWAAVRA